MAAQVAAAAGLVKSSSEGRRMIEQQAVSVDGSKVSDVNAFALEYSFRLYLHWRYYASVRLKRPLLANVSFCCDYCKIQYHPLCYYYCHPYYALYINLLELNAGATAV